MTVTIAAIDNPGSRWRLFADPSNIRLPDRLVMMLDSGQPLAIAGRNSGLGSTAERSAVDDLLGAVDVWRLKTGIDLRPAIPSKTELRAHFANAEVVNSVEAGTTERFQNRFVVIDLRNDADLVLLISTGSGKKRDSRGRQPFVEREADLIDEFDVSCLHTKVSDRRGRQDWALGSAMSALQCRGGFVSSEDGPKDVNDLADSLTTFVHATGDRKAAADLVPRTRRGMVELSGDTVGNNLISLHAAPPAPAGFDVTWLNDGGVRATRRVVFLDTPACRPPKGQAANGMSTVVLPGETDVVDQVANVRWALSHYGTPGWGPTTVAAELVARGFSTPQYRRRHNTASRYTTIDGARSALRHMLGRIDVYETGVLQIDPGAGIAPIELTNMFPPDGPWATPEDFARIRRVLNEGRERHRGRRVQTFSGLPVKYNNIPARMLTAVNRRSLAAGYRFVQADQYPDRGTAVPESIIIPVESWTHSLLDAVRKLDHTDLAIAGVGDDTDDPATAQLRAQLETVTHEIGQAEARREHLWTQVASLTHRSDPHKPSPLLLRLQSEYDQADTEIAHHQTEINDIENQLQLKAAAKPSSAPTSDLLRLIGSLRDPSDMRYSELWRASLKRIQFHNTERHAVAWTGQIILTDNDNGNQLIIPFSGEHQRRRYKKRTGPDLATQAQHAIEELTQGVALPNGRRRLNLRTAVAAALGVSAKHLLLCGCDDQRILRATTRLLLSPEITDHALAEELSEPTEFISRCRDIHLSPDSPRRRSWFNNTPTLTATLLTIAAANNGRVTVHDIIDQTATTPGNVHTLAGQLATTGILRSERKRGYVINACDCGSVHYSILGIPEPDGPVCTQCGIDRSGLIWGPDYLRYTRPPATVGSRRMAQPRSGGG